jgi:hypothetical protein
MTIPYFFILSNKLSSISFLTSSRLLRTSIKAFLAEKQSGTKDYDSIKESLKEAGLDPDEDYQYQGKPYSYGSAWLEVEIPSEVYYEIQTWPGVLVK